jgi:hypothetical protein
MGREPASSRISTNRAPKTKLTFGDFVGALMSQVY